MIANLKTPTWLLKLSRTDEQRWQLITDNLTAIQKIAERCSDFSFDEAYDIVLNSARKCALRFESTRGNFSQYLYRAAMHDLNRARLRRKKLREVSYDNLNIQNANLTYHPELTEEEILERERLDFEIYKECEKEIRGLGESYWQLFRCWVLEGCSQEDLADRFCVTRSTISMRIMKIRKVCENYKRI